MTNNLQSNTAVASEVCLCRQHQLLASFKIFSAWSKGINVAISKPPCPARNCDRSPLRPRSPSSHRLLVVAQVDFPTQSQPLVGAQVIVSLRRCHLKSSSTREPLNTTTNRTRHFRFGALGRFSNLLVLPTQVSSQCQTCLSQLKGLSNRDGGWGKEDQRCRKLIHKQVNSTANSFVGWHPQIRNYFSFSFPPQPIIQQQVVFPTGVV